MSRSRWYRSPPDNTSIGVRYGKTDTGRWIEDTGVVTRLLPDDDTGGRHQRFVLRVGGGQTLLIAHNIEVAGRVPLALGDRARFRGSYEWNELGGVVHWTHRDPMGKADGGWLEFRNKRYL